MRVRELIQDLLLVDPDLEVYIAPSDGVDNFARMDGNGYGWSTDYIDEDGDPSDYDGEHDHNAIVFWPV